MDIVSKANQVLSNNGYRAEFFPSYNQVVQDHESCLFHHIKKCGGMSIHSALTVAMNLSIKKGLFPKTLIARCDTDENWESLFSNHSEYLNRFFISSHNAGDHYRSLKGDVKRVSVFRDPFDRALSYYQYDCMRQSKMPVLTEFERYLYSDDNTYDFFSPFLSTKDPGSPEKVIEFLNDDFFSFFDLSGISHFISGFISRYGLPNIVMDKQNETLDRYVLPEAKSLKEEYFDQDRPEQKVFDWVSSNPRLPQIYEKSRLHKYTLLLHSVQAEKGYGFQAKLFETAQLFNIMTQNRTSKGLGFFFDDD